MNWSQAALYLALSASAILLTIGLWPRLQRPMAVRVRRRRAVWAFLLSPFMAFFK